MSWIKDYMSGRNKEWKVQILKKEILRKPADYILTEKEHRQRHELLHAHLDELTADYLSQNNKLLSETTVMELMEWSYQQTINPTDKES